MEKSSKPGLKGGVRSVGGYLDLGLRLTLSVLIGVLAGRWGDDKLGTSPLFLLFGLFIGITAGMFTLYRAVFPPRHDDTKPQP